LKALREELKAGNLGLSIDLEAANDDLRIRQLAENVDLVVVMAYDEHFEGGEPGPIASVRWTDQVLDKFGAAVRANKPVIGIGSYAYDWSKGKKTESPTYQAALKSAEGYRDGETASQVLAL